MFNKDEKKRRSIRIIFKDKGSNILTEINGNVETITDYYNQYFNTARYGRKENMQKPIAIEFLTENESENYFHNY